MKYVEYLKAEHAAHMAMYNALAPLFPLISDVGLAMQACIRNGGKILLMGNGGSAADSQHIAAEIVGRFKKERKGRWIRRGSQWNMAFAREQPRSRIKTNPAAAGQIHFCPRVQIGEILFRAARPVERFQIGRAHV